MPEMTGSDLAQEMLNIRPDLPIILATGYSNSVDEDQAMAIGVRLFLHKPISLHELVRSVQQAMGEENEDED
jgi:FixJ family two-component response regulator